MRKLLLAVVVLLVVVAGGLVVVSVAFDRTAEKLHTIKGPVSAIVVKSGAGDVDLVPAGTRLEVRETQHYVFTKPKLEQTVTGGVLTIKSDCTTKIVTCYADLRVTVPPGAAVTVEADSGDVDADGIGVLTARLRSDSGDVRLKLIGRQQLASARTDSGDVDVVAAAARTIDAQSDSGDVTINAAAAALAIDAQSDSGDVTIDAGARPRRAAARSDSGDVRVTVAAGAYAVDARTDSGDVKVDGITIDKRAPSSIQARTDSGDVTVHGG